MYFVQRFHIFCVFPNIVVLEPSRDPKATLCQRASQWVSKWLRKTRADTQTDTQTLAAFLVVLIFVHRDMGHSILIKTLDLVTIFVNLILAQHSITLYILTKVCLPLSWSKIGWPSKVLKSFNFGDQCLKLKIMSMLKEKWINSCQVWPFGGSNLIFKVTKGQKSWNLTFFDPLFDLENSNSLFED